MRLRSRIQNIKAISPTRAAIRTSVMSRSLDWSQLKLPCSLQVCGGLGGADPGNADQAAFVREAVENVRGFPDPYGENAGLRGAECNDSAGSALRPIPDWMGRNPSERTHEHTVPIHIAGAVYIGQEEGERNVSGVLFAENQVAAIPRETGEIAIALFLPSPAGLDRCPLGVVVSGGGPGRIIAGVKLPCALDGQCVFSEAVENQRRRRVLRQRSAVICS